MYSTGNSNIDCCFLSQCWHSKNRMSSSKNLENVEYDDSTVALSICQNFNNTASNKFTILINRYQDEYQIILLYTYMKQWPCKDPWSNETLVFRTGNNKSAVCPLWISILWSIVESLGTLCLRPRNIFLALHLLICTSLEWFQSKRT